MFRFALGTVIALFFALISTAYIVAAPNVPQYRSEILQSSPACNAIMAQSYATELMGWPCSMPMPLDGTTHAGAHVDIGTVAVNPHVNFDAQRAEKLFSLAVVFAGLLPEPPLQPPKIS